MESKFLNPSAVLKSSGLNNGETAVDFGAGSGYFALAAAKIVGKSGKVYVVDVIEKSLEHIASEARLKNFPNLKTIQHDLEKPDIYAIPNGCVDVVIIANVLHQIKNPVSILSESYRVLKTSGKLLVIDWGKEHVLGPKDSRISDQQVKHLVKKFNFKFESEVQTDEFHFGLIFNK